MTITKRIDIIVILAHFVFTILQIIMEELNMSVVCSSSNLAELEQIRIDLQIHSYAFDRLLSIPDNDRLEEWKYLHVSRCEALFDTINRLVALEGCIRAGRDFNPASPDDEPPPDDSVLLI